MALWPTSYEVLCVSETIAEETARIRELLSSGAASITVDGVTTQIDRTELRRRLRELNATDPATGQKRGVIQRPFLGGW